MVVQPTFSDLISFHFNPSLLSQVKSLPRHEAPAGEGDDACGQPCDHLLVPDPAGRMVGAEGDQRDLICGREEETGGIRMGGRTPGRRHWVAEHTAGGRVADQAGRKVPEPAHRFLQL